MASERIIGVALPHLRIRAERKRHEQLAGYPAARTFSRHPERSPRSKGAVEGPLFSHVRATRRQVGEKKCHEATRTILCLPAHRPCPRLRTRGPSTAARLPRCAQDDG